MLRGRRGSWFLGFFVSWFLSFVGLLFLGLKVSWFESLSNSQFVLISKFLGFKVSKICQTAMSFPDPRFPSIYYMYRGGFLALVFSTHFKVLDFQHFVNCFPK